MCVLNTVATVLVAVRVAEAYTFQETDSQSRDYWHATKTAVENTETTEIDTLQTTHSLYSHICVYH